MTSTDSRIYCAAVKEPPFEYDGRALQVDSIPRSSSSDLWALLTWKDTGPALTKKGKPRVHQPPKHKDPNGRFYAAQCIHYGFKPFKSKEAAKKELMRAFEKNNGIIHVPTTILDIERKLQADFVVANEAAKTEYIEAKKHRQQEEVNRTLKRSREDDELLKEVSAASTKRLKKQSKSERSFDLQDYSGKYRVSCPKLREGYGSIGDEAYTLSLSRMDAHTVYGRFDFGAFEGYLRSTKIDAKNRTIEFHWRGRETGEGQSTFEDGNIFSLTFVGQELFKGHAKGSMFKKCEISGKRSGDLFGPRMGIASRWKYQYDQLNEENYEYERVNRWR